MRALDAVIVADVVEFGVVATVVLLLPELLCIFTCLRSELGSV